MEWVVIDYGEVVCHAPPEDAAARLAGRLFAERPKAFRARISALWTARNRRNPVHKKQ